MHPVPIKPELIAQAVESANDAVLVTSPDLDEPGPRIEYANAAFCRMTGYELKEILGRTPRILHGPKTCRRLLQKLRADLSSRQAFFGETINYRKDGSEYSVEWRITPLKGPDGSIEKWVAIQRETTEKKNQEEERALLAAIVHHSSDAIVGKNLDGRITSWNPAAEQIFGYSAAEIIGCNIRILLPPDRQDEEETILSQIRRGLPVEHFETIRRRKDGTEIAVSVTISPIRDSLGTVVGASKIARDITAARRLAQDRERLLEQERDLRKKAEHADHMKNEFLATLSHELRTPLTAILGWSQILKSGQTSLPEVPEAAEIIHRNARLQARLVEDLLDMNRILKGELRLTPRQISIKSVVESALESVATSAQTKNLTLSFDIDPQAHSLRADPTRLQQVVWNLLANAIKFTPAGGTVSLSVRRGESQMVLTVRDTGIGMESGFLNRAFDRFSRADSSPTRRQGGLGLGLAIVKYLVEAHGGTVEAQSAGLGEGTTIVVTLPCPPEPVGEIRDLAGIRILLVESDPADAELARHILSEQGAIVTSAACTQEALDLPLNEFHVLVSELTLPIKDGFELLREIRQRSADRGRTIPAIALTAYRRAEDQHHALAAGYHTFLSKPPDPEELRTAVLRCLRTIGR